MKDLLNEVACKVQDKLRVIGIQLDFEMHELKAIEQQHKDPLNCFIEVFNIWENRSHPPFRWETIIEVLESKPVQCLRLAKELKKTQRSKKMD